MSRTRISAAASIVFLAVGWCGVVHGQNAPRPGTPTIESGRRETVRAMWKSGASNGYAVAGQCGFSYGRIPWRHGFFDAVRESGKRRWRLGRDAWTTFETDVPVLVGGIDLSAGLYYVVLDIGTKPGSGALVFIDPIRARELRQDAQDADQGGVGTVVPVLFTDDGEGSAPLTFLLKADPSDTRRLDLLIVFGSWLISTSIVAPFDGYDPKVVRVDRGEPHRPFYGRFHRRSLRAEGGGALTEAVVASGLQWLVRNQKPDGSWASHEYVVNDDPQRGRFLGGGSRPGNEVGVSGAAVLAFLGAGSTHREGVYRESVRKGLKWLRAQQDAEGCFGPRDRNVAFNHGLAALAMVEASGMNQSSLWRASAQTGLDFSIRSTFEGPIRRFDGQPDDFDALAVGRTAMTLHAAKIGQGLATSNESLQAARNAIIDLSDESNWRTGYARSIARPTPADGATVGNATVESESLTAVGMLVRIFAGERPLDSAMLQAGARLLSRRPPVRHEDPTLNDLESWFLGTLAMFQIGGDAWNKWHADLLPAVVRRQRSDGSFDGSWDPAGSAGDIGGRVYSTALMTMCLEVYYRYDRVR